jgi:hypothetical protein
MAAVEETLRSVELALSRPFWEAPDFWIGLAVGLIGTCLSALAFWEARQAKRAATEAGRTVKLQTITIELTEIGQRLDKIQPEIRFSEARDLLAEINRRLRRVTSPYATDGELASSIAGLREALQVAQSSLKAVRPTDPDSEADAPNAVYFGIESDFANINNSVADLLGLFEKRTLDFGDDDAGG